MTVLREESNQFLVQTDAQAFLLMQFRALAADIAKCTLNRSN